MRALQYTLISARWAASVNFLQVRCPVPACGKLQWVRADRWQHKCVYCGNRAWVEGKVPPTLIRRGIVDEEGRYVR